jgi:hypothetical protein
MQDKAMKKEWKRREKRIGWKYLLSFLAVKQNKW